MPLDEQLAERQAKSGAAMPSRQAGVDLDEGLQRPRNVVRRPSPLPLSVTRNAHAVGVAADIGMDRSAGRGELDRVGQQVQQDLAQSHRIGFDGGQLIADMGGLA